MLTQFLKGKNPGKCVGKNLPFREIPEGPGEKNMKKGKRRISANHVSRTNLFGAT